MNNRKSIIMLLFDLPCITKEQIRERGQFVRAVKKNGYIMLQESVYIKLIHNSSSVDRELNALKSNLPSDGIVQVLPLSLDNFSRMTSLLGFGFDLLFFSDDTIYV